MKTLADKDRLMRRRGRSFRLDFTFTWDELLSLMYHVDDEAESDRRLGPLQHRLHVIAGEEMPLWWSQRRAAIAKVRVGQKSVANKRGAR